MPYILWPFWNPQQHRLRLLWRLIAFALVFMASLLLLGAVIGFALASAGRLPGPESAADLTQAAVPMMFMTLVATWFSTWVAGRIIDRRPFADYGFALDRIWWRDVVFGLVLGAFLMTLIFLAEWAAGWIRIVGTFHTPEGTSFFSSMAQPVIVFLCVGIYEELLSRGYLLRNLAEGLNWRWLRDTRAVIAGWVLSSALFGLAHASNPNATWVSTLNLALAGLFLGLGYVLTGQLAIPIGLHITWNLFQGNVFGFPVSGATFSPVTVIAIQQQGPEVVTGGAFGPEGGLIGIFAMVIGSALTLWWVRSTRGAASLRAELARYERATGDALPRSAAEIDEATGIWEEGS
ncbi:MAG: hypothetical protein Kow0047_16480 [Anaerolineae bacterium]